MASKVKDKIYKLLETIKDEGTLMKVMEDIAFYSSKKDVTEGLDENQLKELEVAMTEADNNQVIKWQDFKKELGEWKRK
ncbi:MAG: hypothetical protein HY015_06350 [Bacteroidetes bacterium]|nr:hypothetical protein [Bacteroidota bacterium]MBI3482584.1 hypothetical protein [Bacteroidota bacterium]